MWSLARGPSPVVPRTHAPLPPPRLPWPTAPHLDEQRVAAAVLRDEADKEAHRGVHGDEGQRGGAGRARRHGGRGRRLGAQAVLHCQLDHDAQEALRHLVALREAGVGAGGGAVGGMWSVAATGGSWTVKRGAKLRSPSQRLTHGAATVRAPAYCLPPSSPP